MHKGEVVAERLRKDWSFTPVPSVVLRDKSIPDSEKITYQYLVDHAGMKGKCWVSQKKLARDRGKSLRTIERHVAGLKELGLIKVTPGRFSSDTLIVDVSCLYTNPKVRYKSSDRVPGTLPAQETGPDKNGGRPPDKNVGYKEKREPQEKRKPDTSYPGTLPFGQALGEAERDDCIGHSTNILNFDQKVQELLSPEGTEMGLRPPRHSQESPRGIPDQSLKKRSRGKMTDPDGNPEGVKKKPKKTSKTQVKVHELWAEWKWMIKGTFNIPVPGALPTGSNYGHLKNLVNFSGGDKEYALQLLRYVVDKWEEVKKGNFRAERMNVPTLYLVDALKEELHANIQTGKPFQPKPDRTEEKEWAGGINRLKHDKDYSAWDEMAKKEWEEFDKKRAQKRAKKKQASGE